ncbi:SUMF1/EgtB/PvdO family nonheme iron enzyme [bacterium]|nr:SUMF1/EgtB/PvdO family nonheme iron enzyme [bacterium]
MKTIFTIFIISLTIFISCNDKLDKENISCEKHEDCPKEYFCTINDVNKTCLSKEKNNVCDYLKCVEPKICEEETLSCKLPQGRCIQTPNGIEGCGTALLKCTPSNYCVLNDHPCLDELVTCGENSVCIPNPEINSPMDYSCECKAGFYLHGGEGCIPLCNGAECEDWERCDEITKICVLDNKKCESDNDCNEENFICNLENHTCEMKGGWCDKNEHCEKEQFCIDNICQGCMMPACNEFETCTLTAPEVLECIPKYICNPICNEWENCTENNVCTLKEDRCNADNDCSQAPVPICNTASHYCVATNTWCDKHEQCDDGYLCKTFSSEPEGNYCVDYCADGSIDGGWTLCPNHSECEVTDGKAYCSDCDEEGGYFWDETQKRCISDLCRNFDCGENSSCVVNENSGTPECICDTYYGNIDDQNNCYPVCGGNCNTLNDSYCHEMDKGFCMCKIVGQSSQYIKYENGYCDPTENGPNLLCDTSYQKVFLSYINDYACLQMSEVTACSNCNSETEICQKDSATVAAYCACKDGYKRHPRTGECILNSVSFCDSSINCLNGGTCNEEDASCSCINHNSGQNCEYCEQGYKRNPRTNECILESVSNCEGLNHLYATSCNEDTGYLVCKEGYKGLDCIQCDTGYNQTTVSMCIPDENNNQNCDICVKTDFYNECNSVGCNLVQTVGSPFICQYNSGGMNNCGPSDCNTLSNCSGRGTCSVINVNNTNRAVCDCDDGYTGINCNTCAEGFINLDGVCTQQCSDGMCIIIPETFLMGCDYAQDDSCGSNETTLHQVTLSPYMMDQYEVTVAQFQECINNNVCNQDDYHTNEENNCNLGASGKSNYPMNCLNWNAAKDYCELKGKRLPTEAEWEYAAKGANSIFPWGNQNPDCNFANFKGIDYNNLCSNNTSTEVIGNRDKDKSQFNIYDMAGNVSEWVNDWYSGSYYQESPTVNPQGPTTNIGLGKATRGGSYLYFLIESKTYSRNYQGSTSWNPQVGFRCVKNID